MKCQLRAPTISNDKERDLIEKAARRLDEALEEARELAKQALESLDGLPGTVSFAVYRAPLVVAAGFLLSLIALAGPRTGGLLREALFLAFNGAVLPLLLASFYGVERSLKAVEWLRLLAAGIARPGSRVFGEWRSLADSIKWAFGSLDAAATYIYLVLLGPYLIGIAVVPENGLLSDSLLILLGAYLIGGFFAMILLIIPFLPGLVAYFWLLQEYYTGFARLVPNKLLFLLGFALLLFPVLVSAVLSLAVSGLVNKASGRGYTSTVSNLLEALENVEKKHQVLETIKGCLARVRRDCCVESDCERIIRAVRGEAVHECPGREPRGACILGGPETVLEPLRGFLERGGPVYCLQCTITALREARVCGREEAACRALGLIRENWDYVAAGIREEVERAWRLAAEGRGEEARSTIKALTEILEGLEDLAKQARCDQANTRELAGMAGELRRAIESYRETLDRLITLGTVSSLLREADSLRERALRTAEEWLSGHARPG